MTASFLREAAQGRFPHCPEVDCLSSGELRALRAALHMDAQWRESFLSGDPIALSDDAWLFSRARQLESAEAALFSVQPWWAVLGVSENATREQIETARRRLAAEFRADRASDFPDLQLINAARLAGLEHAT